MAAKVYNYQQPADYLRCTNTTATMQRDDRRQGFPPGEAYPWFNQPTYSLSHDNLSVSYSDPSNLSGTHGANYNHETHGYSTGYSHDLSAAVEGSPANTTWEVSLDPHAIYHMSYDTPGWSGSANSESPYERDRLVLRQAWEQRIRDQWLRRNGINALPTDPQYDRFIPELRAGEYAERYMTRPGSAEEVDGIHMGYSADMSQSQAASSGLAADFPQFPAPSQYYQPSIRENVLQGACPPSRSPPSIAESTLATISSLSPLRLSSSYSLQLPYREPTTYSPTDTDSPTSLHPNSHISKLSTSPATVWSALGSDAADSPRSDAYQPHPTSPVGSPSIAGDRAIVETSSSSTIGLDVTHKNPGATRSQSVEDTPHGHAATGPIRRGNSASERGKNAGGGIRVHRPAGIKWNQRTRCAYINPVTGLQCRTSAGRGPDLERHLRTVHLREEARAVSDGLIPRDKAGLLPPDWVMGDRLDFDCPHCAVRFTREDARDRHVKVQHQAQTDSGPVLECRQCVGFHDLLRGVYNPWVRTHADQTFSSF